VHSAQAAALMDLAARLRREGAREGALRAALRERISALPNPALTQDEVDTIAAQAAVIPPHLVTGAINSLGLDRYLPASTIRPVRLHTAASIATETPDAVDWIAEPWAAAGALTGITGRPKIGKTTFVLDLIAAVLQGRPFLNYPASTSLRHLPSPSRGEGLGMRGLPSPLEGEGPGMRGLPSPPFIPSPKLGRGQGEGEGEGSGMRGPQSARGLGHAVLYLTEQQVSSFRASLARSGLLGHESLAVIFWHESMALSWRAAAALAGEHCAALGARLLVIDTLSQWAGMRGDMENQAGDAFESLQPLQQLAATGIAVVFVQHERKAGGDAADAGRGSSAFAGAVDTLISFRRPPYITSSNARLRPLPSPLEGEGPEMRGKSNQTQGRSAIRLLLSLSRFEDVPPELYIQRTGGRYAVIGQASNFADRSARSAIIAALPPDPDAALSVETLVEAIGAPRQTVLRAARALLADGIIHRTGAGKKGDPHRYWSDIPF